MEQIIIKREFSNGKFDCLEIYNDEYKILEISNKQYWNTNEKHPIVIKKDRLQNYVLSNIPATPFEDDEEEIEEEE